MNQSRKEVERLRQEVTDMLQKQRVELERLSGLTAEEAKAIILKQVEDDVKHETAMMIKEIEAQAKEEAEKRAGTLFL